MKEPKLWPTRAMDLGLPRPFVVMAPLAEDLDLDGALVDVAREFGGFAEVEVVVEEDGVAGRDGKLGKVVLWCVVGMFQ